MSGATEHLEVQVADDRGQGELTHEPAGPQDPLLLGGREQHHDGPHGRFGRERLRQFEQHGDPRGIVVGPVADAVLRVLGTADPDVVEVSREDDDLVGQLGPVGGPAAADDPHDVPIGRGDVAPAGIQGHAGPGVRGVTGRATQGDPGRPLRLTVGEPQPPPARASSGAARPGAGRSQHEAEPDAVRVARLLEEAPLVAAARVEEERGPGPALLGQVVRAPHVDHVVGPTHAVGSGR